MKDMIGRVYAKDAGNGRVILIGAAVPGKLQAGQVYELSECLGQKTFEPIGESQITGDEADRGSVDRLLALSHGRHCMVEGVS
ncbi:hypothetical protein [Neptuniibacter sp. QD37_11]|uniref:hypothetical protein n=1 Tax=Neptuniibacter sp. QD37_11 TaxID=3398209 RepID=UPI0039F5DA51